MTKKKLKKTQKSRNDNVKTTLAGKDWTTTKEETMGKQASMEK